MYKSNGRGDRGFGLLVVLLCVGIVCVLLAISSPIYTAKLNTSIDSLDKSQIELAERLALTDVSTSGWMDKSKSTKQQVYFYVLDVSGVEELVGSATDLVPSKLYGPIPMGVYHSSNNTSSTSKPLLNYHIYTRSVDITTGQIATLKKAIKKSAKQVDSRYCVVEVWVEDSGERTVDTYVWPDFDSSGNIVEYRTH